MKQVTGVLVVLFALMALTGRSQGGYVESAYVVTYQKDTIWGQFVKASVGKYMKSIHMLSPQGVKSKYTADKIKAAGYIQQDGDVPAEYSTSPVWRQYEKIVNPNDRTDSLMVEKIAYGPSMRLFVDPISSNLPKLFLRSIGFSFGSFGSGFSIDLGAMSQPLESFIIVKGNRQPIFITPKNFDKLFAPLFSDCLRFMDFISKNPSYRNFNELPFLVSEYNRGDCYHF